MRRAALPACGLLVAALAAGCAHRRERTLVMLDEGALAPPRDDVGRDGVGRDGVGRGGGAARDRAARRTSGRAPTAPGDGWDYADRRGGGPGAPIATTVLASPASVGSERVERTPAGAVSDAPGLGRAVTSSAPPPHRPLPAGVSLEQAQRETFLACETTIDAEKVTLFLPPRYAAEAVREGETVLRLRRLTVRAGVLRLVARTDGSEDVSISARGHVAFRADRPASLLTETDLKTLLIRNDGYTPLR